MTNDPPAPIIHHLNNHTISVSITLPPDFEKLSPRNQQQALEIVAYADRRIRRFVERVAPPDPATRTHELRLLDYQKLCQAYKKASTNLTRSHDNLRLANDLHERRRAERHHAYMQVIRFYSANKDLWDGYPDIDKGDTDPTAVVPNSHPNSTSPEAPLALWEQELLGIHTSQTLPSDAHPIDDHPRPRLGVEGS